MAGPDFDGVPEHWMAYLHVDDIDEAVEKARAIREREGYYQWSEYRAGQ